MLNPPPVQNPVDQDLSRSARLSLSAVWMQWFGAIYSYLTSKTNDAQVNSIGVGTVPDGVTGDISLTKNLNFIGTGNRITGDFTNSTFASRVAFQSNVLNGNSTITVIPNGTATTGVLEAYNTSDPTNSVFGHIQANVNEVRIQSGIRGSVSYLPMTFYTGGSERMRIDTSGNVTLGGTSTAPALKVAPVASQVNFVVVAGAIVGTGPGISAAGAETNVSLTVGAKGTGQIYIYTGGGQQVSIQDTPSANRFITLTGSNGGNPAIGVNAGNLSLSSPIVLTSQTVGTTVGVAGGASALPATPLGYLNTNINGVPCKIPYYN